MHYESINLSPYQDADLRAVYKRLATRWHFLDNMKRLQRMMGAASVIGAWLQINIYPRWF